MKRLFKVLFIFLIILLPFNIFANTYDYLDEYNDTDIIKVSSGTYDLIIDDQADIVTEADEIKLQDEMYKLLEFGNIAFVTTNVDDYSSTESKARDFYYENFGTESGTVFYIDMAERYIYIFSNGENSKVITNMKANTITDNVYTYASDGDYYGCASEAFSQIYTVLTGGKIAEPLRFICSIILSLITSFMFCFIYAYSSSRKKQPSAKEIRRAIDCQMIVNDFEARITGEDRVYNPPSDSGSSGGGGGSSGGGGGGGGGGSGGGHRF